MAAIRLRLVAAIVVFLGAGVVIGGARAQLRMGFYEESCPAAERIVGEYVRQHVRRVPTVAAALLRLHYHDCFVRGGPTWRVATGRRDGTVSRMEEALAEIPSPAMSFQELAALFATKGLTVRDLVWLSGAHTIGIAHCSSFADRLYAGATDPNANTTTDPPPLDAAFAANLRDRKCRTAGDGVVEMDPGSHLTFDLSYYRGVLKHRCLLRSDAALVTDAAARADIAGVVDSPPEVFFQVFGRSMARLGMVQVKTGSEGEIRRNCAVVNS
uniref:Plant heme peroxidase family profile domain-containing protein n=1 Tax=Leersia perrieri TaxID=77586 RepID=A0A0D9VCH5_9ORYZ